MFFVVLMLFFRLVVLNDCEEGETFDTCSTPSCCYFLINKEYQKLRVGFVSMKRRYRDLSSNKGEQIVHADNMKKSQLGQVPIGGILIWPGVKIPEGWLLCNGSKYFKSDYPSLFNVLANDKLSDTTFEVPDFRGKFLRGVRDESEVPLQEEAASVKRHTHLLNFDSQVYVDDGTESSNMKRASESTDMSFYVTSGVGTEYKPDLIVGTDGVRVHDYDHLPGLAAFPYHAHHHYTEFPIHAHRIKGDTAAVGGVENVPVNTAVNFVIKAKFVHKDCDACIA